MKKYILSFLSALSVLVMPLALAAARDQAVMEHAGKLDQLFTLEEAAKIAGKPAGEAEMKYSKSEKYPTTEVLEYRWKGGRKRMTTGTIQMELPVLDSIKVGWMRKATLQELKDFRAKSEAEDLPDVGEYAFLAKEGLQHVFFKNGIRFSVWVNLSDDPKANTAQAVAIARLLLEKL
ncbi:MAG: hypothetical protein OJI67_19605 [Prosthecobacter sp.]|nr:hypothetical protein [Prosthecobacter sp.]